MQTVELARENWPALQLIHVDEVIAGIVEYVPGWHLVHMDCAGVSA